MFNDTLPSQIDVRKLVVKGTQITATVPVSTLVRFVDLLSDDSGSVDVDLQFYLDDQRIRRVDGVLHARVNVICERCLESMPITIDCEFALGVVWSEEDSKRLPAYLEPLIVGEELIDLSDIVSEELILSFPIVSYHAPEECQKPVSYVCAEPGYENGEGADESDQGDVKKAGWTNPFKVLEQLKPDNNH